MAGLFGGIDLGGTKMLISILNESMEEKDTPNLGVAALAKEAIQR